MDTTRVVAELETLLSSQHWSAWLDAACVSGDPAARQRLRAAWALVEDADGPRASVAARVNTLVAMGMDADTRVAAVLHAAGYEPNADDESRFGAAVIALLRGVRRIETLAVPEAGEAGGAKEQVQAENLRRMLLALVDDIRVVLIKLADRLQAMRGLTGRSSQARTDLAIETRDLYAPLANRLGIWQIKWELEDLALRFTEPDDYHHIARWLAETRDARERYVNAFIEQLRGLLDEVGIEADISGRAKHIYSIWNKMRRKHVPFNQLYDIRAVRVLVDSVEQCYACLGIVHSQWQYIGGEFDDYIARPKPNLYRSLHTAVIGPAGKTIEVQIRTREMHQHAELGVAAHWRYKEGTHYDASFEGRLQAMRRLLELPGGSDEGVDLVEAFRSEADTERVYVMTPRGAVIDLPQGATPVDFAYAIHSDVGHRTRGAKVNGRIVPLTHILRSGETVEVITKNAPQPSRDWLSPHLGYTVSGRARGRIRAWFRQQDYEQNLADGRQMAEQEMRRLGVQQYDADRLLRRFNLKKIDDVFAAMGRGDASLAQFAGALEAPREPQNRQARKRQPATDPDAHDSGDGVSILGVGDLLTQIARCCRPVPPEPIVGFITRGRGVTVHRANCHNIESLTDEQRQRLIDVEWNCGAAQSFAVDIQVHAYDRKGLLSDITAVLAAEAVNVTGVSTQSSPRENTADMRLTVEVHQYSELSRLFDRIAHVKNVLSVRRAP